MRVSTTLHASTGDITYSDSLLLDRGELPCLMQNEYGYLLTSHIPDASGAELRKQGYSDKLVQLLLTAAQLGIGYIHIDRDEESTSTPDPSWV